MQLQASLEQMTTPGKIVHAIMHGLTEWESATNSTTWTNSAPYHGTVLHTDCILVQAFLEQSNEIGWEHFLHGRISTKWGRAYQLYNSKPHQELVKPHSMGKASLHSPVELLPRYLEVL
jgi:activator of HSP90 ATPase